MFSHRQTLPSFPAVANNLPSKANPTAVTSPTWPRSRVSTSPEGTSQRTISDADVPATRNCPSGENATAVTSAWGCGGRTESGTTGPAVTRFDGPGFSGVDSTDGGPGTAVWVTFGSDELAARAGPAM